MNQPKRLGVFGHLLHGAGLSAALAAVGLVWVFLYEPIRAERAGLVSRSDDLRKLGAEGHSLRARCVAARRELSETEGRVAAALRRIPGGPHEADFLAELTVLAHDAGLELVDYRPRSGSPDGPYQSMEVHLLSRGTHAAICRVLGGLGELGRLCRVTGLKVVSQEADAKHQLEMTLRIYFAPGGRLAAKE